MFVIVQCENEYLCLERGEGGWTIPSGGREGGESMEEAMRRELAEEGGFWCDGPPEWQEYLDKLRQQRPVRGSGYGLDDQGYYSEGELKSVNRGFLLRVGPDQRDAPRARMFQTDPNEEKGMPEHVKYEWLEKKEFLERLSGSLSPMVLSVIEQSLTESKYSLRAHLL